MKKHLSRLAFAAAFFMMLFAAFGNFAVETSAQAKPTVALVRADWCRACQQLEPTYNELKREYGSRINFVEFDVTNEETTAAAETRANKLGLGKFFAANKKNTSTVAVFKGGKQTFTANHNYDRQTYVNAFEKALK